MNDYTKNGKRTRPDEKAAYPGEASAGDAESGSVREQKGTEEALRESEQRYRALAESAHDFIFIIDRDGLVQYVNAFGAKAFGYPQKEIIGRQLRDLFPPETSNRQLQNIRKVFESGSPLIVEQRTVFPGWELWLETRLIPLRDETGEVRSILGVARDTTQRRQAEQTLRESEQKFRVLTETVASGIFIHQGGKFLYVNPASEVITGYTRDELLSMNVGDIIHPDFRELVRDRAQSRLRGEPVPSRYELKIITKDGKERWVELTAGLMEFEGKPAVLATHFDITERKAIEETAKQMAQENFILAEIGRIINSTLNINEVYERFADEVRKIIPFDRIAINIAAPGHRTAAITYSAGIEVEERSQGNVVPVAGTLTEEVMRSRSGLIVQSEDQTEVAARYPALFPSLSSGLRSFMGIPLIAKDQVLGTLHFRSKESNAYSEKDLNLAEKVANQIAGAIANALLFAEQKRTEEALRESETRFKDLYDNAPLGYHEYDAEGRITKVNHTDEEMLGYSNQEMVGQFIWKLSLDEEDARRQVSAKLAGDLPPGRNLERTYRRKDGTTLQVLIEDRLILDATGKIKGIRCTIQDITQWKKAKEEVATLQEQLRQSQKMEAIGRLAGGVAHDFNNLLTIIKGYSQLSLMELKEEDPLKGNIEIIQKASERAAELTRQLLAFSRRQIMEPKVLDLNGLLRDMEKMLHRVIGEDIELVTLLAEDLGRTKIDPGQIEQVILNLAVNARDAMPSGGKLTIETANVELDEAYAINHDRMAAGRYVMLSVSDTGQGMTSEVKEQIFDPFFTTKEKGKGTGLGLSMVYGIVKQSGGNVSVYSEPGHGTAFKVYLPRVEEETSALARRDEASSMPRGDETVLLVEDEPSVRDLAVHVLRRQGYNVLEAPDGNRAFLLAQNHSGEKIHLLVTDVVMPRMGGRELADRLKSIRSDMKVLFISGYTDNAIVHHGVLDPGIEFLQKPFSPSALVQKVREVLDRC